MSSPRPADFADNPLVHELLERCTFADAPPNELDCAVSGGADSSALLILAVASGATVTAHHVDHGLRPGSADEASVVASLAAWAGARFVGHTVEVGAGPNLEARARAARFGVLPPGIATGHTLDDRAETMLINLLRGAARGGLTPLRDPVRHPIAALRRADTVRLCEAFEVAVVHDESNDDPTHLRNRIRHEALPMLEAITQRDLAPILDRQAEVLSLEDDLLDELAAAIDVTDARALAAVHPALARRAVRRWITQNWSWGHPPGARSVDRVLDVAAGTIRSTQLERGYSVHRRDQRLRLESTDAP